ncbi:hypothetical protein LTR91_003736 [Friedmanniomyces endolithicus]|uniref:Zn(2)-C6 fungal-type domain-containing protein n=1 Tax=Friedmanniomyces endolithicus TaxID=329885 RepID=A0AAN6KVU8_9PEZI|nr:hypothetical protein LTR57_009289 [Friedmanniomyces endolithicus]KAK0999580.1 hypothetical protein LTS01_005348 [Friedmanniomyces endolithicus]KAK1006476.1 hypothetical protein LTR91_003736 [Friedmanniomyces endolithicus]KAK1032175.1 hypothetical protein LTS16_017418 [Friedmanniomyces endolithicus]
MEVSGSGAPQRPIPRRSHKKSKTGCQTCKARKIKVWDRGICEIRCADMAPTLSAMRDDPSVELARGTLPTSPPATLTTRTRRSPPPPLHPPPQLSPSRNPQAMHEHEEAPPHRHTIDNNSSNNSPASLSDPPPP